MRKEEPGGPTENTRDDAATDPAELGLLLAAAHYHCRQAFNNALRPVGIEARHFAVLRALARYGPSSQRRLVELLDTDKSAMVRIVDELERQGLAERRRDEHDRRAYAVALTDDGRARLAATQQVAAEAGEELFGGLRPQDRERLAGLLRHLVERHRG